MTISIDYRGDRDILLDKDNVENDLIFSNTGNVVGSPPFRVPKSPPPEGVVRVVELPTACASIVMHLHGVSYVGSGGRPVIEDLGRRKVMRYLYGVRGRAPRNVMARYRFIKRAVIATIPEPGYRDGYVIIQFSPMVSLEGFPVSTIATRVTLVSYDVLPSRKRVAEAVAATLVFMSRRYGTNGIGEAMNVNALRYVLGPEEATPVAYVAALSKKVIRAKVWGLKNLPPLPKVEFYRVPPKHKVKEYEEGEE